MTPTQNNNICITRCWLPGQLNKHVFFFFFFAHMTPNVSDNNINILLNISSLFHILFSILAVDFLVAIF